MKVCSIVGCTNRRYGSLFGSCSCCTCPIWRPVTGYTIMLAAARSLLGKGYR